MFTHSYFGFVMSYKFDLILEEIMSIPALCLLLGKGNFLLNKSVSNRQSDLTRLDIIVNRFDKLQSNLTK
jgi:hypothetical protein